MSFTKEEIKQVEQELAEIKAKDHNISDVSDLMKRLVIEEYGDEDWSTSGYWVRAEKCVIRYKKGYRS